MRTHTSTLGTDLIFNAMLVREFGPDAEEHLQTTLRRMCRSLTSAQGNLLGDLISFPLSLGKDRLKLRRHFLDLLDQELMNQHDYQHQHEGHQDPPHGPWD